MLIKREEGVEQMPGSEGRAARVGGPASHHRCQYVHPRGRAPLMNDSMDGKAGGA